VVARNMSFSFIGVFFLILFLVILLRHTAESVNDA